MRAIGSILLNAVIVVAAAAIGFGVPAGWVWIGSQLQGETGATSLNFSVAVAILAGIIVTYVALLYLAGWLLSRFGPDPTGSGAASARAPWMRGMTDTRAVRGSRPARAVGLERLFVTTTLLVSGAFWVWFFFFAGSPLPTQ